MTGARTISVASVLGGVTLAAWIVLVGHMRGMDMGPGTDLGGLGWFLLLWVTMTTAMMLPSVAPMALLFARVSQGRVPIWVFLSDYLAAWSGFGLLAYAVFRLVRFLDPAFLGWQRAGPWIAGGAVTAAGLYQLTPLKRACLRHCRSPLHFVLGGWRTGRRGALELGAQHGAYCVRLLLGVDGRAVRARRDEPVLDGRRRGGDLRREGDSLRGADLAAAFSHTRRPRDLGCGRPFERAGADAARNRSRSPDADTCVTIWGASVPGRGVAPFRPREHARDRAPDPRAARRRLLLADERVAAPA